jgi:HPt (histidine-containing phosphotransfer) domain-containing protein
MLKDMRDAVANGDAGRVRGILHKLKSSYRFAGALRLAELCERFDRLGDDGDLEPIAREMPAFDSGSAELAICIADYLLRSRAAEAGAVAWQR